MTVAKQMDVRSNIKKFFDLAFSGEAIFVPRKNNRNVFIISQEEYESLQKAKRIAEYIKEIDKSAAQIAEGEIVVKSLEELRAME